MDETEAELGETVFNKALFFECEIASSLLLQHGEQINGMAGDGQVGFGFLLVVFEIDEAELHLGLHHDGFDEERETGGRDWIVGILGIGHGQRIC